MIKLSKKITLTFALLLMIFFIYETFVVNSKKTFSTSDMICLLSSKMTTSCSGTPVLEKGSLKIFSNTDFELIGHYNACFHIEDVIIKGQYQSTELNDSLEFELLGKQMEGTMSLPKTIGLVKLNKLTLEGVFIDIWAAIRAQDNNLEKAPSLKVVCQLL